MTDEKETFSARLGRLRRRQGLTAKAMAKAISVAESTYRDWEDGRGLKLPPVQQISQVFAISVTELITGLKPEAADELAQLAEIEEKLRALRIKMGSRR